MSSLFGQSVILHPFGSSSASAGQHSVEHARPGLGGVKTPPISVESQRSQMLSRALAAFVVAALSELGTLYFDNVFAAKSA